VIKRESGGLTAPLLHFLPVIMPAKITHRYAETEPDARVWLRLSFANFSENGEFCARFDKSYINGFWLCALKTKKRRAFLITTMKTRFPCRRIFTI
jgi:hypothetical protein